MVWFSKSNTANEKIPEELKISSPPEEEWIWVEGYKGTDKDMMCRDVKYELNKQFDMSEDAEIVECKNGFHLCLNLQEVFEFYPIGQGNRFFKVQALVRKTDKEVYGKSDYISIGNSKYYNGTIRKIVAKSIIFVSELTVDEILSHTDVRNYPEQYKQIAINSGIPVAINKYQMNTLIADGYSEAFAAYINSKQKFEVAHAVGTQKDLSMDIKVLTIFLGDK
jgi:hypothetical protein